MITPSNSISQKKKKKKKHNFDPFQSIFLIQFFKMLTKKDFHMLSFNNNNISVKSNK